MPQYLSHFKPHTYDSDIKESGLFCCCREQKNWLEHLSFYSKLLELLLPNLSTIDSYTIQVSLNFKIAAWLPE